MLCKSRQCRGAQRRGFSRSVIFTGKSSIRVRGTRAKICSTVQNVFAASEHWRDYDVFQRQKDWTFIQSRVAVEELAKRFSTVISTEVAGAKAQHLLFEEMTQIALWGNATDLSLLTKLSLEDIQSLQGSDAIARNRRNIVSDDTEAIWKYLNSNAPGQVDLVLDNSGFEFFADLIYACYLLQKGLASKVQLHTKTFPWFVSDVTPRDVTATLDQLSSTVHFPNREGIDSLTHTVQEHLQSGCLVVDSHPFWTTSLPFTALPQYAPDLFEELRSASVVIFKGDLNYRKLVNDGLWPFTTPFKDALGSLGRESGVRIVALRTNKADVCVGISDEQKVKQLEREAPNSDWTKNGKYAVISFSDGV